MSIPPYFGDNNTHSMWDDLGNGAPTIMALANMCGHAMMRPADGLDALTLEAQCLLYLGRHRGAFEVKATDKAFDAVDRFLTVHVELEEDDMLPMRIRGDAEATSRLFAGFCQLCSDGLVMHHIYADFSLTTAGFERAKNIRREDVIRLLEKLTGNSEDSP